MRGDAEKMESEFDLTQVKNIRHERLKIIREVLTQFAVTRELADGYALGYRRKKMSLATLKRYAEYLSRHFSFFCFEPTFDEKGEHVWLQIKGPGDAKEYIRGVLNSQIETPSVVKRFLSRGFKLLTSRWRVMPQFLIIGAAKCGTSSLFAYLTCHPDIMPADRKEICFFDRYYARGLGWYRSHFPTIFAINRGKPNHKGKLVSLVSGEASPSYLIHPLAPRRILHTIPSVKLIVMLRNPVDRAYSFYQHQFRGGYEVLPFEKAIEREAARLDGEWEKMASDEYYYSLNLDLFSYLFRGLYIDQLMCWFDLFPREQLLILVSEDFYRDPSNTLNLVCDFLDIPPMSKRTAQEYERFNYVPYLRMDPQMRQRLVEYFKPYNRRLYDFLGRDLGWDR